MYDTAIIGGGPAGLSAAINLKQLGKEIIWFSSENVSDKIEKAEKIVNYPGFSEISGHELNESFSSHAERLGLTLEKKLVSTVSKSRRGFNILAENEIYNAKTVLFATGVVLGKPLKGEAELVGSGVSYCATCDGFLYKGKTIAVWCGGKQFEHEVKYLASLAEKVYAFAPYKDCELNGDNIALLSSPIFEIAGQAKVTGIKLRDGSEIDADGVFFLKNAIAPSSIISGLETDGAHIVTDRSMATSIDGCFAAGDCTGRPYQIAKAVGEGNIAAHSIVEYLSKL